MSLKPTLAFPRNNEPEWAFCKLIQASGGTPVNRGWPDYAVFGKDDRLKAFVEVKPIAGRKGLLDDQHFMLSQLASFGVPCFIWSPAGLARILADGSTEPVEAGSLIELL